MYQGSLTASEQLPVLSQSPSCSAFGQQLALQVQSYCSFVPATCTGRRAELVCCTPTLVRTAV